VISLCYLYVLKAVLQSLGLLFIVHIRASRIRLMHVTCLLLHSEFFFLRSLLFLPTLGASGVPFISGFFPFYSPSSFDQPALGFVLLCMGCCNHDSTMRGIFCVFSPVSRSSRLDIPYVFLPAIVLNARSIVGVCPLLCATSLLFSEPLPPSFQDVTASSPFLSLMLTGV